MYLSLCKLSGKPSIKQHNAQFSCHFSLLSNYRVNEFRTKRLGRAGHQRAHTAHSTLAVEERCCRADGTSPKVVETILCAGPNMPPTIRIVVNVSAKTTVETCLHCLNLFRRPWVRSPPFRMIRNAALYSYKSTQCHVISLFSIEKNRTFYLESDENVEIIFVLGLERIFQDSEFWNLCLINDFKTPTFNPLFLTLRLSDFSVLYQNLRV